MIQQRPKIAIIDPNTLAVLGLRSMLQEVMPSLMVDTFATFEDFMPMSAEPYVHYFVAVNVVLSNRSFFNSERRKTIVLTSLSDENIQLNDFRYLRVNVPEKQLVRSLLALQQTGHPHGHPSAVPALPARDKILSDREIEVLSLIVRGYINKEVADKLHIGLSTVITHRKNIMDKLKARSVSALTIYAVMQGYVDINQI